jgi:hypothetical protein
MPIDLHPIRFSLPAVDRATIKKEGHARDGHGNTATSFGLGFPENPILIDLDGEEGNTEFESGSA